MLPPPGSRPRDIEKYLAHGERVVLVLRRHAVVLERAIGIWLAAIAAGVGFGLLASHEPHWNLGVIGGWIVLAGAGFLTWKTGAWWIARYVITDERVLLIDGVVSRRVRAVPLSKITHTDYRRTLSGRLLGYGTISLDSAGSHDGLRADAALADTGPLPRLIL